MLTRQALYQLIYFPSPSPGSLTQGIRCVGRVKVDLPSSLLNREGMREGVVQRFGGIVRGSKMELFWGPPQPLRHMNTRMS